MRNFTSIGIVFLIIKHLSFDKFGYKYSVVFDQNILLEVIDINYFVMILYYTQRLLKAFP